MDTNPISILVIDGDSASRKYLASSLSKAGYLLFTASLGREGLVSAWRDRPDIIIFDPILPDLQGLEVIKRLRLDRRTAIVPCVALSSRVDSHDRMSYISAGCNDYLEKTDQSVAILLDLIPRLLKGEVTPPPKRGILISFLSVKGGVGTSSLCSNIAMCLGSENIETRVAVMDMVLPIGSIADIVGHEDSFNIITATQKPPDEMLAGYFREKLPRVAGWYFHLLTGSPDPESANHLVVDRVDGIVNSIVESFDYILVDLGRAFSRITLPILQKSEVIVLVIGTDLSNTIITNKAWNYLKSKGIDSQHLYVLQNRAVGLEGLTKSEIEQMTGLQVRITIPYLSGNMTVANNRHEPLISRDPNDSGSITIKQAASQIVELGHQTRQ
jgi:Flp pilus assembly CpaE family ATPase